MGNNGTGKTSLLEAFRILIGSQYLAFDKYKEKIGYTIAIYIVYQSIVFIISQVKTDATPTIYSSK